MYPTGTFEQPRYTTAGYHPWQSVYQSPRPFPLLEEQPLLDHQSSHWRCHLQQLPYQPDGHQQRHPYHARQPTSWDPPWMRQTTTYQQPPSYKPDMYGLPSYQHVEPSWQQQNPCLGTPPWQPDHIVLYPSIPPPLPQRPLSWDLPSFQPLATALLPTAVAAPPHAYDSRQPSRLHIPSSMNECSIENTFEDNVKDLERESESERRMPEESHNFDDISINDGAFDADDKLIPQCTDTSDRSLDSTLRSSLMGPSLEQLQSEQVDKIKERSCPERPVVVRQPLLRSTSPCCSALTPMAAAAVPRPPQPHPPFYSQPLFVTDKDRIWEEVPRNVVVAIGANVASINHRSTTLDTCIVCITNKGIKPAGILIDVAKKIGLSSVCEVLHQGDQYLGCEKVAGVIVAHSISKQRRENSFNGKADSNLPDDTDEKSKKAKNAFFFTVDVLTLRRLCASLEHLPTFDPGGEVSPKLMFAMLFIVSWFPP